MNDADLYASYSSAQQLDSAFLLTEVWPWLDSKAASGPVLDVGCGAGDVSAKELRPRLSSQMSLVACDISTDMLQLAKSRFQAQPKLHFAQLDIGTNSIEESAVWARAPYSKIFSFFCLHWVHDQRRALENINKLLAAEGEIVLLQVSSSPLFELYENFAKNSKWSQYMQDVEQFVTPYQHSKDPAGKFKCLLEEAGFKVKYCQEDLPHGSSFEKKEDAIGTVKAINPFVSRIPEELHEEYFADIIKEMFRVGGIDSQKDEKTGSVIYTFKYKIIFAHAVKS